MKRPGDKRLMGLSQTLTFGPEHLHDRDLILRMLKAEDQLYFSKMGQEHIAEHGGNTSTESGKVLQRAVLLRFGFDPSEESIRTYRSVIHHYYKSATDYDKEIMDSVVYLRENKLLYYTTDKPLIGSTYKDVRVYDLMDNEVRISDLVERAHNKGKNLIVAAFSTS